MKLSFGFTGLILHVHLCFSHAIHVFVPLQQSNNRLYPVIHIIQTLQRLEPWWAILVGWQLQEEEVQPLDSVSNASSHVSQRSAVAKMVPLEAEAKLLEWNSAVKKRQATWKRERKHMYRPTSTTHICCCWGVFYQRHHGHHPCECSHHQHCDVSISGIISHSQPHHNNVLVTRTHDFIITYNTCFFVSHAHVPFPLCYAFISHPSMATLWSIVT